MGKILLTGEQETLLIPLYGKAVESGKKKPLLVDRKAMEIVSQIDYDFNSLRIPGKTNKMMCLRAKLIDNFVRGFLGEGRGVALHLGCGLDSRYDRVGSKNVDWYDVDYGEVMEIRRVFYEETDCYHMIASSVTEEKWLQQVQNGCDRNIVIAEGLFMYLGEGEIRELIGRLKNRLGGYTLIFDAFSVFTARKVKSHPSLKKTGAKIRWGIDNPKEMESWDTGIHFAGEVFFTSNEETGNLDPGTRIMYKIAGMFPAARKAQRLLVFKVD